MNRNQLEQSWDEYYPKVYGFFFRRVSNREDVEDLTSITMTVFLNKLESETITHHSAYMWKIAQLQLLNYIRNKSKSPLTASIDTEVDLSPEIESIHSPYLDERIPGLLHCVEKNCSPQDYTIVCRIAQDDVKAVDVAKELNMTAEAIRQRFRRALQKLRKECSHVWNI